MFTQMSKSESLLTIGEIAACARHLAKDPFGFSERCRHWAKLGLLQATDRVGEGAGRHALFSHFEAYMAAVICALAEAGLQPAASRPVADAQSIARHALATWLGERAEGRPQPVLLLEINFYRGGGEDIDVRRGRAAWQKPKQSAAQIARLKARGIDPARFDPARAMTTVRVNLSELVRKRLRGVEGEQRRGVQAMTGEPVDLWHVDADAPLRLDRAVKAAFPFGGMTVSGLRREAARGRLVIEVIAGKQFTTLRAIEEMRTRCRVLPKEPNFGSIPAKSAGTENRPPRELGHPRRTAKSPHGPPSNGPLGG